MDFRVDADHTALRQAVREVTQSFGPTYYVEHAEAHEPTDELWRSLGKQGFIGINVPEKFGGGGAGMTELTIVCEETAAAGSPLLLLLVSQAISAEVLVRYGSPEQQDAWLPGMASGETKVVFAITEPEAGSNTHQLLTTARRDGTDWLISGHPSTTSPGWNFRRPARSRLTTRFRHRARVAIAALVVLLAGVIFAAPPPVQRVDAWVHYRLTATCRRRLWWGSMTGCSWVIMMATRPAP